MKETLELLLMGLNLALAAAALVLGRLLRGSLFAAIPRYILILAIALMAHSAVDLFASGPYEAFIYGVSALIASVCFLFLVYEVFLVLKKLSDEKGEQ